MMKKRLLYIVLSVIILLCGCTSKEEQKQKEIEEQVKKTQAVKRILFQAESGGQKQEIDFPVYSNAEEVVERSDLIISGKVVKIDKDTEGEERGPHWGRAGRLGQLH